MDDKDKAAGEEIPASSPHHESRLLFADLTDAIIGAAIEFHRHLGPGLLEATYEDCLREEMRLRGVSFRSQIELPVFYKGRETDGRIRIDLIVADAVVVELKAVERVMDVHRAQLLTYMRLTGKRVGLLINFNVPALRDGITRRVL